jgi:hypothetical protein
LTQIITLIGDPGGGKSTLGKVIAMIFQYLRPDIPRFSNVQIGEEVAVRVEDMNKLIAMKLIRKDHSEMFNLEDEAAQTGLESRGSGSKAAAIESRVITHSRKAGSWLVLVAQLKSMLDKRAQWTEAISILCEAKFFDENISILPDYFEFTIFDNNLNYLGDFSISTDDCIKHVWPGMDTYDIPDFENFKKTFETYWSIGEADNREYEEYMRKAHLYAKAEGVSIG